MHGKDRSDTELRLQVLRLEGREGVEDESPKPPTSYCTATPITITAMEFMKDLGLDGEL